MTVKVVEKATGKEHTGKYAVVDSAQVALFSGSMSDKKGGLRGCGRKTVFEAAKVAVTADDPSRELKRP